MWGWQQIPAVMFVNTPIIRMASFPFDSLLFFSGDANKFTLLVD
jgi:hypothetical protein